MSLTIGLGADYTSHITERFTQELTRTDDAGDALETAVSGTGGALLGSTVTTVAAFSTLVLLPFPDVRQLALMVAIALLCSFVMAVYVLPSLLVLWARYTGPAEDVSQTALSERELSADGGRDRECAPEQMPDEWRDRE